MEVPLTEILGRIFTGTLEKAYRFLGVPGIGLTENRENKTNISLTMTHTDTRSCTIIYMFYILDLKQTHALAP